MMSYDRGKIGKLIAIGAEHFVYRYGDNHVIKFPRGIWYWMNRSRFCEDVRHGSRVIERYFGDYINSREIFFDDKTYVVIERYIKGRHVRISDMNNLEIRRQLEDIVSRNTKMMSDENMALEFFGLWCLLYKGRREIANIILEEDTNRLVIVDFGVLRFTNYGFRHILSYGVIRLAVIQQRRLINYYFGKRD